MNKQQKKTGRGIEWTDYTWNPIAGCFHACQWTMPDGSIANCYAEDVAERVAGHAYPHGFEHHYWHPEKLNDPMKVKTPAKIFCGSMADIFGHWVTDDQIYAVLEACTRAHWHTFQLLTKNSIRPKSFTLPNNVWVGASSPPDFMWNKPLTVYQRHRMLNTTLQALQHTEVTTRWMSFEPLSWDVSRIVEQFPGVLQWAVIGAASNGAREYAPDEAHVRDLIDVLDSQGVKVFFKGNLKSLKWAAANWREEFPSEHRQLSMFGD